MRIQVQLKRIIDLMFLLNDSRYGWSIVELAKRYKVHPRTISRDLSTLSQMMLVASKDDKWYGLGNAAVSQLSKGTDECKSATTK